MGLRLAVETEMLIPAHLSGAGLVQRTESASEGEMEW